MDSAGMRCYFLRGDLFDGCFKVGRVDMKFRKEMLGELKAQRDELNAAIEALESLGRPRTAAHTPSEGDKKARRRRTRKPGMPDEEQLNKEMKEFGVAR